MSVDDAASDDSELESSGREGDDGGVPLAEGSSARAIPAASDSSGWATRVVDVGQPRRATSRPLPLASLDLGGCEHVNAPAIGLLLGALPTLLALNIGGTKIGNDELAELSGEHPHCYLYRR